MIRIDGSYKEGGGQILRYALAFSIVKKIPIEVYNIRAKRPKPGLKMQHLTIIKALEKMSNSKAENVFLGSTKVKFYPSEIKEGFYSFNIETAGSISLFLQTFSILSCFYNFTIEVIGGTSGKFAPTIDFFDKVILDNLRKFGFKSEVKVVKRGFYPKGQGKVIFKGVKSKLRRLNLIEKGKIEEIEIISVSSSLLKQRSVAERQIKGAKEVLLKHFPKEIIKEKVIYDTTASPGTSITIIAKFSNYNVGSDNIGEPRKLSEDVGREAAKKLIEEIEKGGIDIYCSDNLIPYLFIFGGKIKVNCFSNHLLTALWLGKMFFDREVKIDEEKKIIEIR